MYAEERQQEIVGLARRDGRVDVAELAEHFDVTPETIRRDLTALERPGVLRRVHGGAIPVERLGFEPGAGHPRRGADRREGAHRQGGAGRGARGGRDHPRRRHDHRPAGRGCCRSTGS